MKPWKSEAATVTSPLATSLQWGHGDEAVEELVSASSLRSISMLQWGHGDEAVEEGSAIVAGSGTYFQLQWGHGDEAVEERIETRCLDGGSLASMGPRR